MADFITLTSDFDDKVRINVAAIASYFKEGSNTQVHVLDETRFTVTETPEQIDALLDELRTETAVKYAMRRLLSAVGCARIPRLVNGLKVSRADIDADGWGRLAEEAVERAWKSLGEWEASS